jgi:hypothetical protein
LLVQRWHLLTDVTQTEPVCLFLRFRFQTKSDSLAVPEARAHPRSHPHAAAAEKDGGRRSVSLEVRQVPCVDGPKLARKSFARIAGRCGIRKSVRTAVASIPSFRQIASAIPSGDYWPGILDAPTRICCDLFFPKPGMVFTHSSASGFFNSGGASFPAAVDTVTLAAMSTISKNFWRD